MPVNTATTSRILGLVTLAVAAVSPVNAFVITQEPLFLTQAQPPLVMVNMTRDHRLYYEAYNDASDLDGDGSLDVGYKPGDINYYGYFDSFKCYDYDGTNRRFNPVSVTTNKRCSGNWSGDFLNYVTTSRMDALRKVLYGGTRVTDSTTATVLQRVFIPQDAHSWGKEYESIARDGYDIADYTPLSTPVSGRRHLFANVTLAQNDQTTGDTAWGGGHGVYSTLVSTVGSEATNPPLLRVLQNSPRRIWNWMSKERPVAGRYCLDGTNQSGSCFGSATAGGWQIVPNTAFTGLNASFYALTAGTSDSDVANTTEMTALKAAGVLTGTQPISRIDCDSQETYDIFDDISGTTVTYNVDCNPLTPGRDSTDEYYFTEINGSITVPTAGTYFFAIDGNNNVDLFINGTLVKGWYHNHSFSSCKTSGDFDSAACNSDSVGSIALTAGTHTIQFRHHEHEVYDGYRLWWKLGNVTATRTNFEVRVKVCDPAVGLETNCKTYTDGTTVTYKPTGLLHTYGASNGMYFGLLSGSYARNLQGGVLRKNISSFQNEISATTGIFTASPSNGGIVDTINRLRITGFRYSDWSYQAGGTYGNCGWITTRATNNGECQMWGNPLGEMVWESLRYFNGQTTPTSDFDYSGTTTDANILGLPKPSWWDPYSAQASRSPTTAMPYCSKPYILAVSDAYPTFDSDSVPGSPFGGAPTGSTLSGVTSPNVESLGNDIWSTEFGGPRNVFIGHSLSHTPTFDSAPTAKNVTSFGNIRGLAPSDPTRQGSFATSSLAYWARMTDLRPTLEQAQKTGFYSVALAPPMPTIEIPVTGGRVTIVPFAKSVGGSSISATEGAFQPTNQIVDFYIDTIKNTNAANSDVNINGGRPFYRFRINFEDVEQGADHDMDAIVVYEVWLNADGTVTVNLVSEYAAGGIIQHMGYVISGTSADGTYLAVRDYDTAVGSDPDYFLDTPRVTGLTNNALPLVFSSAVTPGTACVNSATNYACRTFTPSTTSTSAVTLKDPLWYAAKWGGFSDANANNLPDTTEWDADIDGVPDNYFLVVNPLKLERQMAAAFEKIAKDSGTAAALATNSTSLRTELTLYQARFSSEGWGGELNAYPIDQYGELGAPVWQAQYVMSATGTAPLDPDSRVVVTYDPDSTGAKGIPFRWSSMTTGGTLHSSLDKVWNISGGTTDGQGEMRIRFLRGDNSITSFRTRPCISGTSGTTCITNNLGDIVNSSIQYVGAPAFGYTLPFYEEYFEAKKNRTKMVYAGGNDGLLHGFDADTGAEKLAYIPSQLYRSARLSKLTAANYGQSSNPHAYFVDGTPTVGDVCTTTPCTTADNWKTMLVGGLGGGGQGVYALDISNPADFSETNAASLVMWEFTDNNDADLGYTFSRPAIVRQCTARDASSATSPKACTSWRWVVVFGNGYNSDESDGVVGTGRAALFVLDALTGAKLHKVYASTMTQNGFANVSPADVDSDGIADYVYAGDAYGNMFKFILDDPASLAYTLYTAKDTSTPPLVQPITSAPELYSHPNGGVMVLFGSGKYLEASDRNTPTQQTFYGIWDKGTAPAPALNRSDLQVQSLLSQSTTTDEDGSVVTYSTSTRNTVDWSAKRGWYLDLSLFGSNPSERVVYDPQILGNALNFVTIIPSNDICDYGGDSWDFLLDPLTGGRLPYAAFKGNTTIISSGVEYFASRRKSSVGISPTGTVISVGKGTGINYKGGSTGEIEKFGVNLKAAAGARLSWREIRTD